jgi:hypothetical protein
MGNQQNATRKVGLVVAMILGLAGLVLVLTSIDSPLPVASSFAAGLGYGVLVSVAFFAPRRDD